MRLLLCRRLTPCVASSLGLVYALPTIVYCASNLAAWGATLWSLDARRENQLFVYALAALVIALATGSTWLLYGLLATLLGVAAV